MAAEKKVIIIAGPTAVGKTAIGLAVAKYFQTSIISADSRQCYQELNIGVARPSVEELAEVPHYFIASHSIHQQVTAATFEEYALAKAEEIFQNRDVAVMVGGTGLYLKAFTDGMDAIPDVPKVIHDEVVNCYKREGIGWLQEQIRELDPQFYTYGEIQNPQRMMRALEVVKWTGQSIHSFRKGEKKQRPFHVLKLALEQPREQLYQNINTRVDQMMVQGLLQEVEALSPFQHLNALQTVGYKELFDYYKGRLSLEEAVASIKQNTRHYAKRQLTWFRKDKEYLWCPPDFGEVLKLLT